MLLTFSVTLHGSPYMRALFHAVWKIVASTFWSHKKNSCPANTKLLLKREAIRCLRGREGGGGVLVEGRGRGENVRSEPPPSYYHFIWLRVSLAKQKHNLLLSILAKRSYYLLRRTTCYYIFCYIFNIAHASSVWKKETYIVIYTWGMTWPPPPHQPEIRLRSHTDVETRSVRIYHQLV